MGSSRLTLPLDTVMHGQASGDTRHAVSKLVGHDRRVSGRFEKFIRLTEMALFTNPYLLIHGESAKIVLVKVVELHVIYKFALGCMIQFAMVYRLQCSKVVYLATRNQF